MTGDDDRIAYLSGEGSGPPNAEERADLDELRALLADPSLWAEPAPGLEDRIVASISAEPRPVTAAASPPIALLPRRRRLLLAGGGLAAAVVVAVALAVGLSSTGPGPRQFHAALAGTSLVPGASGRATLTRTDAGWEVVLYATGLPRLDDGRFYQAWMKNSAGVLVPIGTFNQGPVVTLWSGVYPATFPTLTVTEQTANGNPASSGRQVLVGEVNPRA